jgi:hypothetical protein
MGVYRDYLYPAGNAQGIRRRSEKVYSDGGALPVTGADFLSQIYRPPGADIALVWLSVGANLSMGNTLIYTDQTGRTFKLKLNAKRDLIP